jgi:hypothetical protein
MKTNQASDCHENQYIVQLNFNLIIDPTSTDLYQSTTCQVFVSNVEEPNKLIFIGSFMCQTNVNDQSLQDGTYMSPNGSKMIKEEESTQIKLVLCKC